ncbi:MAG: methyltransferase type 11 [Deltaproteobacteria bacterium]|nr:methyltransferase type 11 [Deltaproteobacteria bacterium]MBU53407.1 methyltransferase type 11 [Deltaproteobacteria bacterium]|tara:strand:+ start:2091 stop:2927 length:837 start_codon:yes stop_codon:yes gene_type:complete
MNQKKIQYDWPSGRGDKWCEHLVCMEAMLQAVDTPLIEALSLDTPCRVAEIGCGGGGTTQALRAQAPKGSVIHGFDISKTLVEAARARTQYDDLLFEHADVSTKRHSQAPYDRLVSRFGVMFFKEPLVAFSNLRTWLREGGTFAFAVWGAPSENVWAKMVRDVVDEVLGLAPSVPDSPGPFRYADVDAFVSLLEEAGFSDVTHRSWRGALPVGGGFVAEEAARFALSSFSSFRELLDDAGADVYARAHHTLTERFAPYERDGIVRIDALVHLVTGAVS